MPARPRRVDSPAMRRLLVLLVLCLSTTVHAKPLGPRVDAIFKAYARKDSPGCAVAVVQKGKIIHKKGYGMADLERGVAITPETIFDIASVSKQFTATAVLLLVAEGKLSLDDDVRKYVP